MKKYNKIWIPVDSFETVPRDARGMDGVFYKPMKDNIVLSIEELSALWNAGHRAGYSDAGKETRSPAVDFETYLQSKGISI